MKADLEVVMNKIQAMEEDKSRQVALKSVEEKKIMELEGERKNLVEMVNKYSMLAEN